MSKSNILQPKIKKLFNSVLVKFDQLQQYFQNIALKENLIQQNECNLLNFPIPIDELSKEIKNIENQFGKLWAKYITIDRQFKFVKQEMLERQIEQQDLHSKYKKLQKQLVIAYDKINEKQFEIMQLKALNKIDISFISSFQFCNCLLQKFLSCGEMLSKKNIIESVEVDDKNNEINQSSSSQDQQQPSIIQNLNQLQKKQKSKIQNWQYEGIPMEIHDESILNKKSEQKLVKINQQEQDIYQLLKQIQQLRMQQLSDLNQSQLFFSSDEQKENLILENQKQKNFFKNQNIFKKDEIKKEDDKIDCSQDFSNIQDEDHNKVQEKEKEQQKNINNIVKPLVFPLSQNVGLCKSIEDDEQFQLQMQNYPFKKLSNQNYHIQCVI